MSLAMKTDGPLSSEGNLSGRGDMKRLMDEKLARGCE